MPARRVLPLLLLLFVGSGCTALVYEVVWFQLLQLVIGVSAVSLGVLLATFMAGLGAGSALFPRLVPPTRHPLVVYAALEVGIAVAALLALVAVPRVGAMYSAWSGTGATSLALRAIAAAVCLLPPTLLMGATLPALARWVRATPDGVAWLGWFYAGNTTGAVIGCLLAGFHLLRVHDLTFATLVAVALNGVVAAAALALSRIAPYAPPPAPAGPAPTIEGSRGVLAATALSGFTALAAEVVWTRQLSLIIGGTTYTFSLVLAAFLVGIGAGSAIGSAIGRGTSRPRVALATCQALLAGAIAWGAWTLGASMPWWPVDPSLASRPEYNYALDAARALWAVLPAALLWGASFPLAMAALATEGRDPGALVGRVYAANTAGAIAGALAASLLLVPGLGSAVTQKGLVMLAGLAMLLAVLPEERASRLDPARIRFVLLLGAWVLLGSWLVSLVPPLPGALVAYGRFTARQKAPDEILYVGEGLSASVAVTRVAGDVLAYHNSGKVQASTALGDMRLQRMLGHFTTLMSERPRSVFVIGCGAGVTAGAVSLDPAVERLTIVEIEPLVLKSVARWFGRHNANVLTQRKTRAHADDARHWLQTTHETFDAITADPLDPWVKGAAMLYTEEFFELLKRRLNPGGTVTLFVQLYQCSEAAVKSEVATFMRAFPGGVVFATTVDGVNYDLVLAGRKEPIRIDVDAWDAKLRRPEYAAMARSLREVGFASAGELVSTYAGRGPDLGEWMRDAEINRDQDLRLQYIAGMGLNQRQGRAIYEGLLRHRREPAGLFVRGAAAN